MIMFIVGLEILVLYIAVNAMIAEIRWHKVEFKRKYLRKGNDYGSEL